jgi:hypothetical protein
MQKIITMLGDPSAYVRQLALETIAAVAQHGEAGYQSAHS